MDNRMDENALALEQFGVGQPVLRVEDPKLLKGEGRYTDDVNVAGQAHAYVVRSRHAHGTIRKVDVAAACKQPGVLGAYSAADLAAAGVNPIKCGMMVQGRDGKPWLTPPRPVLAAGKVRFSGEAVALVVAETATVASEAAELIAVDYEELPGVVSAAAALASGAPALWDEAPDNVAFLWRKGEEAAIAASIAQAAHVTRLAFAVSRVAAAPLEPRVAMGLVESDGTLVLHTSHQSPYQLRNALAPLIGAAPERLRVVAGDVGGSFGMKAGVHPEEVLVLFAARRLGRPVRWVGDRGEGFLADDHARDIAITAELALDRDGRFMALRVRQNVNIGAYLSGRSLAPINNIGGIAGVYRTPAILAEIYGVFTNTAVTAPYRGAGRPEATYTIERLIDAAAAELGIAPFELRRRNLVPAEAMPFKTALTFTYDCGDFAANMGAAARLADLEGFPARREAAARRGRLRGLGIANPIEVAGGPFGRPGKDVSELRVAADGAIVLTAGAMSTGQGLETAFAQLVADRLGVPLEAVSYRQGETDALPAGRGSGGSSALCVGGTAVSIALDRVIEAGKRLAGELLEAASADIELTEGRFRVAGTDRSVTLAEAAALAEDPRRCPPDMPRGLAAIGEYQPTDVTFPNGCHICEVDIDPETGQVAIVAYSLVEDVGRVINPMLVEGQVHGGIAQGIGQALGEAVVYEPASGQLLTASFMDYAMPRAGDLGAIALETRSVPTAVNPLGVKGVGEAGTVGALAATMNAVCDALAPLGIRHLDMPASPQRVWAAIVGSRRR
jgi:aerobic carbon-monoxide dehydrogenase large subunit